jgi:hypothetical protein
MFLLLHSSHTVGVQHPLHSLSAPNWVSAISAVHFFSASGSVFHLKQGIWWAPAKIAALPSESFLLVAAGSTEIHVSQFISIWIHWEVSIQQMCHMLSPSSFIPVLIPPLFLLILLQLNPPGHAHCRALAPVSLMRDMRCHQTFYSVSLECVSRGSQMFVST